MSKLLIDALNSKGVIGEREIEELANALNEKLKPRKILAEHELEKVTERLRDLTLPTPKSWAEAGWVGVQRQVAKEFSPDRVYRACELQNLITTLNVSGLRDKRLFGKLEKAA